MTFIDGRSDMQLPIDTRRLSIVAIGDPQPQLIYGTTDAKVDAKGRAVYKVPVLLIGTGDRVNPTTTITVAGPLPSITNGSPISTTGLIAFHWTLRGDDGRERSGITLRADAVETAVPPKA